MPVYEIMWKNIVERGRSQMNMWRIRTVCWIRKATNIRRLCNTRCHSTATMVTRTRLNYVIDTLAVWLVFVKVRVV
jgi:hypothetical protein